MAYKDLAPPELQGTPDEYKAASFVCAIRDAKTDTERGKATLACAAELERCYAALARQPLPFRLPSEKTELNRGERVGMVCEVDGKRFVQESRWTGSFGGHCIGWYYLSDILTSFESFLQEHEASMKGEPKNA